MFERRGDRLLVPAAVGDGGQLVGDGQEWIGLDHPDRQAWEAYLAEEARRSDADGAPDGAQHEILSEFATSHRTGLAKTEGETDGD